VGVSRDQETPSASLRTGPDIAQTPDTAVMLWGYRCEQSGIHHRQVCGFPGTPRSKMKSGAQNCDMAWFR